MKHSCLDMKKDSENRISLSNSWPCLSCKVACPGNNQCGKWPGLREKKINADR